MKSKYLILSLALLAAFSFGDTVLKKILDRYRIFASMYYVQKIYVHLDKDQYMTGEHIWFKIYLTDESQRPDTISKMAYVELIGPDSKIKDVRIIKLHKGMGYGDFSLPDTLYSGIYLIRAYTNLMKNFGEKFFFKQSITIKNPKHKYNLLPQKLYLNIKSIKRQKNKIFASVNFSSNGLISGLKSNIYVRIHNILDQPVQALIFLLDKNKIIYKQKTDSLGLAIIPIKPISGHKYKLLIKKEHKRIKIKLPEPIPNGYNITCKDTIGFLKVKINAKLPETSDKNFKKVYLLAERNGKIYHTTYQQLDTNSKQVFISQKLLPSGIVHLILFNGYGKPVLDQLAFVRKPTTISPKIQVVSKHNNQVKLSISVDPDITANFSLAVTGYLPKNLISFPQYLSLKADIPEAPSALLKEKNINKNINAYQWTRYSTNFIWNTKKIDTPKYKVQTSLQVSGTITKLFMDIPVKGTKVKLTVLNSFNDVYTTTTDKYGRFYFTGLNYPDTIVALVEARSLNGTKNVLVYIDKYDTIPTNFLPVKNLRKHLKFTQEKPPKIKHWINDRNALHSHVDQVFYMKDYPNLGNINVLQFLQGRVPGYFYNGDQVYFRGYRSFLTSNQPLFLIDNTPVDINAVKELNIDDVERIEIIKNMAYSVIYGRRGQNGVIAIYTKQGHHIIRGYWKEIQPGYYTPKPFTPAPDSILTHYKTVTFYWNPEIKPKHGNTIITFNLPQGIDTIFITIEGITSEGQIIFTRKKLTFTK